MKTQITKAVSHQLRRCMYNPVLLCVSFKLNTGRMRLKMRFSLRVLSRMEEHTKLSLNSPLPRVASEIQMVQSTSKIKTQIEVFKECLLRNIRGKEELDLMI